MRNICRGVVIEAGHVLMVQERLGEANGLWTYPGGEQKEGETRERAVVRELDEEANIKVEVGHKLHTQHLGKDIMWHAFFCRMLGGELRFQDEELYGGGWFRPEQLATMAENLRDPDLMIKVAARAFAVVV